MDIQPYRRNGIAYTPFMCVCTERTVQSALAGWPTGVACPSPDAFTRSTWKKNESRSD